MGLLDGGLQRVMGAAFGPLFLAGTLTRRARTEALNGDVIVSTSPVPVRVMIETVTEVMRQTPGYTVRDVRLRVLQAGVGAPPTTDDTIDAGGATWAVGLVTADPAQCYWDILGQPA